MSPTNVTATKSVEKMPKPFSSTSSSSSSASAMNTNTKPSNLQSENQDATFSSTALTVSSGGISHPLAKYQGQKWHQLFDVDKVIKQIRLAEKIHIKGKSADNSKGSSNASNAPPIKSRKLQLRQVQRLNGHDMHYFGIAPKQTTIDIMVCNLCMGIYTKVGFNNHVSTHHPAVWATTSAKLVAPPSDMAFGTNDNSQDSIKGNESTPVLGHVMGGEVMGSPSDLSATMSTCSNASSCSTSTGSSTAAPIYNAPISSSSSRQKSSSKAGSSSGRSRSKSKHHSSSSSSATAALSSSTVTAENTQHTSNSSKKSSSKKNSSSTSISNANCSSSTSCVTSVVVTSGKETAELKLLNSRGPSPLTTTNTSAIPISLTSALGKTITASVSSPSSINNAMETSHASNRNSNLFGSSSSSSSSCSSSSSNSSSSSSSNSSYSSPTTPNMLALTGNQQQDTGTISLLPALNENSTFSPTTLENNKDKLAGLMEKRKIKNPAAFNMTDNIGRISSDAVATKPINIMSQQQSQLLRQYDSQISELDQAVSSITVAGSGSVVISSNTGGLKLDASTAADKSNLRSIKLEPTNRPNECNMMNLSSNQEIQPSVNAADDGQMVHNTSDDSAMLNHVLDVMLDSKLINEILNAETEINFDENVLNEGTSTSSNTVVGQNQMQHQTQQTPIYLDQPLTKRMRYDETSNLDQQQQQIAGTQGQEITGNFSVYPQQQTVPQNHGQQQQQQYGQYNSASMSLDNGQYHQTSIDTMQLQQLLYQQQQQQQQQHQNMDSTGYALSMGDVTSQQQQMFDPNSSIVDTKQMLELCSAGAQQNNSLIKAGNYVVSSHPEDVSHQFQIFNVPSLTDDVESQESQQSQLTTTTHHIVERQYVMSGNGDDEQQLIYAITTNDPDTTMSQHHQQQVLAEFLNQAATSYEQHNQFQQNIAPPQNPQQSLDIEGSGHKSDMFYDDLWEFDYSLIDTVKSLSSSSGTTSIKADRADRDQTSSSTLTSSSSSSSYKYHDDFYLNVFFYAGIPRPLAINCFGLIKLPQAVSTTFRKHLLTARKANNSLMSLGSSSLNGVVVGQTSTSASSTGSLVGGGGRFATMKQLPSYFTNLGNNGTNSLTNEFSIGSITITNATAMQQQQGSTNGNTTQNQNKQSVSSPLEISLNTNNNGIPATSPVAFLPSSRGRTKSAGSNSGSLSTSLNSVKHKSLTGLNGAGGAQRVCVGTMGPYNAKTIIVSSNAPITSERSGKFIKRSLITKLQDATIRSGVQQQYSAKKLADMLSGKKAQTSSMSSSASNSNNNLVNSIGESVLETNSEISDEKQAKMNRVNRFYERRRKLLTMTQQQRQQNIRHAPYQTGGVTAIKRQLQSSQLPQQQQQQQQQQQKLLKQQLMRSFSDCGINATPNSTVSSADSNVMRVFV